MEQKFRNTALSGRLSTLDRGTRMCIGERTAFPISSPGEIQHPDTED